MAKPNPLAQGLERLSKPAPAPVPAVAEPALAQPRSERPDYRKNQVMIGGFFSQSVHKQLKLLAAEREETQQALMAEALNMLFAKYGKPEIAAPSNNKSMRA